GTASRWPPLSASSCCSRPTSTRSPPWSQEDRSVTRWFIALLLALAPASAAFARPEKPYLLQAPSLSARQIVFAFAGDLWIVGRDGGDATRLTAGAGVETDPHFSPDGTQVAFTGQYDGNTDVYVVPAAGGVPKRLTYHPGADD